MLNKGVHIDRHDLGTTLTRYQEVVFTLRIADFSESLAAELAGGRWCSGLSNVDSGYRR